MNSYIDTLKLEFDPFAANHGARHFFEGGDRKETLDRLIELTHYAGNTLVVTGGLGSGKSTLAQAYLASLGDEAVAAFVPATLFMNELQLLESICDQAAVDRETLVSATDLIGRLKDYASLLTAESRSLMIIIDDAHELGIDAIEVLADLKDAAVEGSVHLLFLAERQLLGVLESSNASAYGLASMSIFELEVFSAAASREYIQLKLSSAGYKGDFPLSGAALGDIVNKSAGVPGAINSVVRTYLDDVEAIAAEPPASLIPQLPRRYLATAAGLLLALLLVLFFPGGGEEEPQLSNSEINEDLEGNELLIDGNRRIQVAVGGSASAAEEPVSSVASPPRTDIDEASPTESLAVTSRPSAEEDKAEAEDTADPIDLALQIAAERSLIEPVASAEATVGYSSFEQSLLDAPPSAYTLQLLGTYNQESAKKFISEAGNTAGYGYFETVHEGRPWFVVVSGSYPSREQAGNAIDSLPLAQRQLKPWARSLGGVQSDIRRASEAD